MTKYSGLVSYVCPTVNKEILDNTSKAARTQDARKQHVFRKKHRQKSTSCALVAIEKCLENIASPNLDKPFLFQTFLEADNLLTDLMHNQSRTRAVNVINSASKRINRK